jgi:hypothetical protein
MCGFGSTAATYSIVRPVCPLAKIQTIKSIAPRCACRSGKRRVAVAGRTFKSIAPRRVRRGASRRRATAHTAWPRPLPHPNPLTPGGHRSPGTRCRRHSRTQGCGPQTGGRVRRSCGCWLGQPRTAEGRNRGRLGAAREPRGGSGGRGSVASPGWHRSRVETAGVGVRQSHPTALVPWPPPGARHAEWGAAPT